VTEVGDLVQMTDDDRTDRTIEKSADAVCGLYCTCGGDEKHMFLD
jgi:hypothetical protein